ncbi:hypothetical protein BC829DRAFT_387223 [Chytridium lagenaria]|nr:hypothetical protein BC829DRAFT_387223 [Chytridium lagenaria]
MQATSTVVPQWAQGVSLDTLMDVSFQHYLSSLMPLSPSPNPVYTDNVPASQVATIRSAATDLVNMMKGGKEVQQSQAPIFVLYTRKSVTDGDVNRSMEDQRDIIERWARIRGFQIHDQNFRDLASGMDVGREGLDAAIQKVISDPSIAGLVVYRIDRLSRSTLQTLSVINEITENNKTFASATEDNLMFGPLSKDQEEIAARTNLLMKCFFAEVERMTAIKRTKDSSRSRRRDHVGQSLYSPYGTVFSAEVADGTTAVSYISTDLKERIRDKGGLKLVPHAGEIDVALNGSAEMVQTYLSSGKKWLKASTLLRSLVSQGKYKTFRSKTGTQAGNNKNEATRLYRNVKSYILQQLGLDREEELINDIVTRLTR